MWRRSLVVPAAIACVLVASAGCAKASNTAGSATTTPPVITLSGAASPSTTPAKTTTTTAAPSWPTPEDCISYHPNSLTVHYEAGLFAVNDGSTEVMLVHGGPTENTGDKALALAQRYTKHCFLGRNNTREEKNSYIFDYWRNASGMTPTIADQDQDCSDYNRNNLTVEDMGDGNGWRVKDHDHVLHLFDKESDARNGKLVLSKYHQICFIGTFDDNQGQDAISYFL
jgi:hypothetical protein